MDRYITIKEYANKSGLTERALFYRMKKGDLVAKKRKVKVEMLMIDTKKYPINK